MPEQPLQTLNLRPKHLQMVRALLQQHLPLAEVWAYGSRVNGNGHEASDLDLVVRQPTGLNMAEIREAWVESNLPIRVEIVDWARIPADFHNEIERSYVVVQAAQIHRSRVEPCLPIPQRDVI
jgi:predicted nucleotidyltransferase